MRKNFIYAVCHPISGKVKYVGVTRWLITRADKHINGHDSCTRKWVRKLRSRGLVPSIRVLALACVDDSRAEESRWIARFGREGGLLNKDLKPYCMPEYAGSERLLRAVRSAGHTLASLSKRIGCSSAMLSNAARGKSSISSSIARLVCDATVSKSFPRGFRPNSINWPCLRRE